MYCWQERGWILGCFFFCVLGVSNKRHSQSSRRMTTVMGLVLVFVLGSHQKSNIRRCGGRTVCYWNLCRTMVMWRKRGESLEGTIPSTLPQGHIIFHTKGSTNTRQPKMLFALLLQKQLIRVHCHTYLQTVNYWQEPCRHEIPHEIYVDLQQKKWIYWTIVK